MQKTEALARAETTRLYFVQWLRVFLICLVVAHHAGQPYGPTGGAWPVSDPASSDLLLPFFALNAAFFMGFFFLIAGYFVEGSYDRKGPWPFLRSRLSRLGIPLLVFVGPVFGSLAYMSSGTSRGYFSFLWSEYLLPLRLDFGPLWFIAHLLLYSFGYAAWRVLFARKTEPARPVPPPGHKEILAFTLMLAVATVLVRLVYPQDTWVKLLWLIPAEPAHLPQYVGLFVLGIVGSRGRWFTEIDSAVAYFWFWVGLGAFALAMALFAILSASGTDSIGGIDPGILWGFMESFVCVGTILGLLVFFRERVNRTGVWLKRLEGNVYGVYLIHIFVVVALQSAILGAAIPALSKFTLVSILGIGLSFLIVYLLRRISFLRAVI